MTASSRGSRKGNTEAAFKPESKRIRGTWEEEAPSAGACPPSLPLSSLTDLLAWRSDGAAWAMRTESSEAALAKLANAPVRSEADALGAFWFQEARKTEEVKSRANDPGDRLQHL